MTNVTATPTPTVASTSASAAAGQVNGLSADFNTFLKLLTAQMQNQDPLSPMDTSQFTQQLVQFSQVEQSVQQTGALKDILAKLSTQDMAQASAFVGREVRVDSAVSGLGAAPASWGYAADRAPASLVATVSDASGKVVSETPLDPRNQGQYVWDGSTADGGRAADGAYTLTMRALDASGENVPVTINSVGTVKEAVANGGAVELNINGVRFPFSGLVAVSSGN